MPIKSSVALCGLTGSCAAAIGVPVTVHESNRERSIGGDEWANSTKISNLLNLPSILDNTARVSICKALDFKEATHVNNSQEIGSSGSGIYTCYANEGKNRTLMEKLGKDYYEGQWKDMSDSLKIRCKSTTKENSGSVSLDGSLCRKK